MQLILCDFEYFEYLLHCSPVKIFKYLVAFNLTYTNALVGWSYTSMLYSHILNTQVEIIAFEIPIYLKMSCYGHVF